MYRIINGVQIDYLPLKKWWVSSRFVGITLNKKIYVRGSVTDELLLHEYTHKRQQELLGWGRFLFLYIGWWFRRGYANIPFEVEANKFEKGLIKLEDITKDSWKNYA